MNVGKFVEASRAVAQIIGTIPVEPEIHAFAVSLARDPVRLYKYYHNHNTQTGGE